MFAKAWKLYLEDTFDFIEVEKKDLTKRTTAGPIADYYNFVVCVQTTYYNTNNTLLGGCSLVSCTTLHSTLLMTPGKSEHVDIPTCWKHCKKFSF